jgi:hypothetical protein
MARSTPVAKLNQPVQGPLGEAPKPAMTQVMVCSEGVTPIRHNTQGADFFNETYFSQTGRHRPEDGHRGRAFLKF